jgi:glutaredoxin
VKRVTLFKAADCHLCDEAWDVLRMAEAEHEVEFELEVVDIGDDPELERRYRAWLPVVEIDGRRAFTYVVDPGALRDRLRQGYRRAQDSP